MMFWILFCVIGDFADLFNKFNANINDWMNNHYKMKDYSTFLHKVREQDVGSPYCYGPSANYMYYWYNKAKERIISP